MREGYAGTPDQTRSDCGQRRSGDRDRLASRRGITRQGGAGVKDRCRNFASSSGLAAFRKYGAAPRPPLRWLSFPGEARVLYHQGSPLLKAARFTETLAEKT